MSGDSTSSPELHTIRVELPHHLRNLAKVTGEAQLEIRGAVTLSAALDALEAKYPMLAGTIRDHSSQKRRDFLRFLDRKSVV